MKRSRTQTLPRLLLLGAAFTACPHAGCAQDRRISGDPPLAAWTLTSSVGNRVFIVVNGGPGVTHDYLRPELDRLTKWGEVVFYDQRGCGKTPAASTYSPSDYVADLDRVVDAVSRGRQVVLVGSSWGSWVIGWYLRSHPAKAAGVVISGTGGKPAAEVERRLTSCPEAERRTAAAARGAFGADPGLLATSGYVLDFRDHGDGRIAAKPIMTDKHRMEMAMPGHDPWFTDPQRYLAAVDAFVGLLESSTNDSPSRW